LVNKLFITDCEGPLSINDNAFELTGYFIPQGEKFFSIVSKYDDILVDEIKRQGYHAGDTLKLIVPFLKAYGATNKGVIDFSRENVLLVPGAQDTLNHVKKLLNSFIVSTSYGQYINALCDVTEFPFENTYYTQMDLEVQNILDKEKKRLIELKDVIVDGFDFDTLDKIFFEEIPEMEIGKFLSSVKTVGGEGKRLAVEDIVEKTGIEASKVMYVGDSITDVEPLRFVKENNGLAISFNGNEYAVREAEIAVISQNTIVTSILADLHSRFNRDYILGFVKAYSKDPEIALENFRISFHLVDQFKKIFNDQELPEIELINDNWEEITKKSVKCRKKVRGEAIGGLG
jgi:energy-converting hydrogenase A subunit R